MQKLADCSNLNPDELNSIFDGLTAALRNSSNNATESTLDSSRESTEYPEEFSSSTQYPEESIIAETPVKTMCKFVKNSGLVPYETSSEDNSCIEIDSDSELDSRPASPVFKIPPKVP